MGVNADKRIENTFIYLRIMKNIYKMIIKCYMSD